MLALLWWKLIGEMVRCAATEGFLVLAPPLDILTLLVPLQVEPVQKRHPCCQWSTQKGQKTQGQDDAASSPKPAMLMTRCDGIVGRNWRGSTYALPSSQREWMVYCFCEERQSRNARHPQNCSGPVLHSPPSEPGAGPASPHPALGSWVTLLFSVLSPQYTHCCSCPVLTPWDASSPGITLPPASLPSSLVVGYRWELMLLLFVPFILIVYTLQYCVLPGDSW